MTRKDKLLSKFLERPTSLSVSEIEKIMFSVGFAKKSGKGSHTLYYHPIFKIQFVVPIHNHDCKPIYKKQLCKIISHLL